MKDKPLSWLLDPKDSFIRYQTLVDVLGRQRDSKEAVEALRLIHSHPIFKRIMSGQSKDGYWPRKETCDTPRFKGALWALTHLGEMAVVPDPRIKRECERFLDLHQAENGAFTYRSKLSGEEPYPEPCLTGNMARTLIVLGYNDDARVKKAIDWLPSAQLEDGGWNCDYPEFEGKTVRHSSFMSTIEPLWAYSEIPKQRWTRNMKRSIERSAEFLLMHRLYKADHHEWNPMNHTFTTLHFPMYFFYDVLHGLRILTKLGYADDERLKDAVHLILSKRRPDGKWVLESDWFNRPSETTRWLSRKPGEKPPVATDPWGNSIAKATKFDLETVGEPSKWITLNCYRALRTTGDIDPAKR